MISKMQEPYIGQECVECGIGEYREPINGQQWHVVCNECSTIMFCYEPLPHQAKFHADNHRIKAFFGG